MSAPKKSVPPSKYIQDLTKSIGPKTLKVRQDLARLFRRGKSRFSFSGINLDRQMNKLNQHKNTRNSIANSSVSSGMAPSKRRASSVPKL